MLMHSPLARDRRSPPGFIRPCQAIEVETAPAGPEWVHEIKHDGFRIIAHKHGERVRLWSWNGRDWSMAFTAITEALRELPADVIVLDGRGARAHGLPGGLPHGPGRHRVEADRQPVSVGPVRGLAQGEEPGVWARVVMVWEV